MMSGNTQNDDGKSDQKLGEGNESEDDENLS